ncbi:MAG: TolC family protein [Bacteroidaceae bacterium]|nr:TolC family protein [Bacteroidaceae bacterium]
MVAVISAQTLSLDSCRSMAIRNNKSLRISNLHSEAAHWQHKSAQSNYYPRLSAVGTYQRTSREMSILSDEQKTRLSNAGTNISTAAQQELQQFLQTPEAAALLKANPQLAALMQESGTSTLINTMLNNIGSMVDEAGQGIVDAFRTDTRNVTAVSLLLTQPIYMGGKIRAYDRITRYAEQIAASKHDIELQDVIVSVDEAYWRIVALQSKKQLAASYLQTVQKLDSDVKKLISEGMATKADGLSVQVKVNEAEVTVIQVDNGLVLARMALAQLCGMPLNSEFTLTDEASTELPTPPLTTVDDNAVETAMNLRPELQALELAADVKREQVKVARSEFMPNLALTAGYLLTNPNLYNGYDKSFGGMFNVGLVLKVPIITWGDRVYKVRQARAEALIAETEFGQAREQITLQVQQNQQKLQEASQRYQTALRSQQHADENLRMATLGLQEGVIPVSNVLEAQTAWLSAHATLVEADIDIRLADLYLRRALGSISQ